MEPAKEERYNQEENNDEESLPPEYLKSISQAGPPFTQNTGRNHVPGCPYFISLFHYPFSFLPVKLLLEGYYSFCHSLFSARLLRPDSIPIDIDHYQLRNVVDPRRKGLGITESRTDNQSLLIT